MSVLAIIPAAGVGVRMGGAMPKQFLSLEGVPIFVHTLRKFAAADCIDEIYLSCAQMICNGHKGMWIGSISQNPCDSWQGAPLDRKPLPRH